MKRYGNLFDEIASVDNILEAIDKASKQKKWRASVLKTLAKKQQAAQDIHDMLVSGTYRTSKYHKKIIFEPKKRIIYSLPFYPDRIVHHAIMNVLEKKWDNLLDFDSYSCRKNKGCHAGSRRCMEFVRRYKYCLQSDISKFYPSVDHSICKRIIRKKIKDKKLLSLLDEIIDSANNISGCILGKNAPIGNLLSQWFGNLYLNELDMWLRNDCKVKAFARYCDDFLIFSDDKAFLNDIKNRLPNYLRGALGLSLSKSRVFPVSHGVDFLGYRHFKTYILIRKRTVKKIKKFVKEFKSGNVVDVVHARGVASSYRGVMKHSNSYNLRTSLDYKNILIQLGVAA